MAIYIHPPEKAEETGREIELKDTWEETLKQLESPDEAICAVSKGVLPGNVALVMDHKRDYFAVKADPNRLLGLYAIPRSII